MIDNTPLLHNIYPLIQGPCKPGLEYVPNIPFCLVRDALWDSPSHETGETKALCHSRCNTIKTFHWSKAPRAEQKLRFRRPSSELMMSPNKW
jgi:hypothetical protein